MNTSGLGKAKEAAKNIQEYINIKYSKPVTSSTNCNLEEITSRDNHLEIAGCGCC